MFSYFNYRNQTPKFSYAEIEAIDMAFKNLTNS